jgi:carboxyl-terminal processing protease
MSRTRQAVALASLVAVPTIAGGFIMQERANQDGARLLDQVMSYVSTRFVDTVGVEGLYEKAAKGLVHELNDPYSVLLTPKDLAAFTQNTGGRYAGVGMQIEEINKQIVVNKVFPNTPAEEAGVQEGDRIVQIDTASTRGWKTDQVANTLKGDPGTKVNVQFARPGVTQPIAVRMTRAVVHIPAVPYTLSVGDRVGYVPLQQFNETATREVARALQQLERQGARGVILDMRGNPGGILDEALATSNLFLRQGQEIASQRSRQGPVQKYVAQERPVAPSVPLVVLVDGGSASASEIVAGALQDHDRAVIVGTTSFGKGLVQSVFPLEGGYALKMTTAKWFTPTGRTIQRERKVVDGRFIEDPAIDSLAAGDSLKKTLPTFKTTAGRTVYGGGGVTPDVVVNPDTLSTAEQTLGKALGAKPQEVYATVTLFAQELKGKLPGSNFAVQPQWHDEVYRRLQAAGVTVDKAVYDAGRGYIERIVKNRVAKVAYGDSAVFRQNIADDVQLRRAIELLQRGGTQRDLFAIASREQAAAKPQAPGTSAAVRP